MAKGLKVCFLARECKKGWRMYLSLGAKDYPIKGIIAATEDEVSALLGGNIVFVHLANSKKEG